jgi:hypothetical protein
MALGVRRLVTLVLLGGAAVVWAAQDQPAPAERMLLSALQGRRYERVSYDAEGRVEERAMIAAGRLEINGDEVTLPLEVDVSRGDGVGRRFSTRWTCAPQAGDMATAILTFSDDLDKPSMRLETTGDALMYPRDVPSDETLPDVSVDVKVRQGFLRILGARTRITLTDRRIEPVPSASGGLAPEAYTITSDIDFRAYAWGIRVRRARFESEETVDPREGLLRHVLRREDGGYSELQRLP